MDFFKTIFNEATQEKAVEINIRGHELLDCPIFNKGSAFTDEERREFGLMGLLPFHVSTMEEQLARTYENYKRKDTDLGRYIFLMGLQDRNETLFYRLVQEHITEMMPIIYTPVVGQACQNYSHIYRKPRGVFVPYPLKDDVAIILANVPYHDVRVIVVTDGERILGLGDQGAGGMGIPIGKLSLYTLCAGIHPSTALPILLDVGTNNQTLIDDPLYLGWRHGRIRGKEYDDFIEIFIRSVSERFPHALLQWEDFSKNNAGRLLERYKNRLTTFNDDIQGTGSVTLAGLIAATESLGERLGDQRIVMLGAGSAATGIANQIVARAREEGTGENEMRDRIWLVDSKGLVCDGRKDVSGAKQKFAKSAAMISSFKFGTGDFISLGDVVKHVRPTILIGTSAAPGAFTREIVQDMAKGTKNPIIFPLSNPTSKCEATPKDIFEWTEGRALVATGSPFPDVPSGGRKIRIGQCNNAFVFPGIGLGVVAVKARFITDSMFVVAARALAQFSPARKKAGTPLYPELGKVRDISRSVAIAVATEAQNLGLGEFTTPDELEKLVDEKMWQPEYPKLIYKEVAKYIL